MANKSSVKREKARESASPQKPRPATPARGKAGKKPSQTQRPVSRPKSRPAPASQLSFSLDHNGQFLFVKRGTSGMAVRNRPINNVYFARDLSKACQVINLVETRGFQAAAQSVAALGLEKQFVDMNSVGFFQNIIQGPVRLYDHAFEVAENADFPAAVQLLATLEQTLLKRFWIDLHVRNAAAVGPVATRFDSIVRPHYPNVDSTTRVITPLLGEGGPSPDAFQLLDWKRIAVVFLYQMDSAPQADLETGLNHLSKFEEPGFLLSFRIPLGPEAIMDRRRHKALIRDIERFQHESPNREIDLAIRRPGRFRSAAEVDAYYDALEPFLTNLYGIDADVSLLSPFKRYFHAVLINRYETNRVRMWPADGVLRVGLASGGEPFGWARFAAGPILSVFNQLDNILRRDCEETACAKCPFGFVCPKALVEPWLIHLTAGEGDLAKCVFERECAINRKLLRRVCDDVMRFSEGNVEDALPLKLEINKKRDLTFVPRDPEAPAALLF
jgi:hypothetical protein